MKGFKLINIEIISSKGQIYSHFESSRLNTRWDVTSLSVKTRLCGFSSSGRSALDSTPHVQNLSILEIRKISSNELIDKISLEVNLVCFENRKF